MTFTYLIVAHLLSDFIFQPKSLVQYKNKSRLGILLHVFIFAVLAFILLLPYLNNYLTWVIIGLICAVHYFTDLAKIKVGKNSKKYITPFIADQAVHYISLLIGGYFLFLLPANNPGGFFYGTIYTDINFWIWIILLTFIPYTFYLIFTEKKKAYIKIIPFAFVILIYLITAILLNY